MRWQFFKGIPGIQADMSGCSYYTISHRFECHTVSYRPPGKHFHVAQCKTARQAKQAAEEHQRKLMDAIMQTSAV